MTAEKALELIKEDLKLVEINLAKAINTKVPLINEVLMYLLSSGGKRLRPAFLILAAKLCGYEGTKPSEISCVVEYIHTATLLHDDIIDGAKFRRSKPSANGVFGNDITVLCGDFLYSRSYVLLTEHGDRNIQKILSTAALTMSEGEVIQLVKTGDTDISMDDYLKIIRCKTAVLFSAACEIGAAIAKANEKEAKALAAFGDFMGLAFQMSDDLLDYMGDPEKTGKKNGTDLNEGKLTLPVILLLKKCTADERNKVAEIFKEKTKNDSELQYIKDLFVKYEITTLAEKIVDEYTEKSLTSLDIFPDNEYRQALAALAKALVRRES